MNIVIVEDEADLLETMEFFLREEGFAVHGCQTLTDADAYLQDGVVDVLVLDLTLDGKDALGWLDHQDLPAHTYVVIASARRGTDHRVAGFKRGADVYLEKPVELYELLAVIRRLESRLEPVLGDRWQFHRITRHLTAPNGKEVRLTGMQQALIESFASVDDHACSHAALITALGHSPDYFTPQRLDSALRRLRKTTEEQAGIAVPIENSFGWGYIFAGPLEIVEIR